MQKTIEQLAARWAGADKKILRHVFPLLAEGLPVQVERIAERSGASAALVEKALTHSRASRDAAGRVTELCGLLLAPSLNRVEVDGVVLFSCCALLAHMTPFLLGRTVKLESVDPQSRGLVRLELTPTAVAAMKPAGVVGSFVETDENGMGSSIGEYFCRHVHHFTGRESANAFAADDERRYVVEVGELRDAAERLYRATWA